MGTYLDPSPIVERYNRVPHGKRDQWCQTRGFTTDAVGRWSRGERGVSRYVADRFAIVEGRHPLELWPDFNGSLAA